MQEYLCGNGKVAPDSIRNPRAQRSEERADRSPGGREPARTDTAFDGPSRPDDACPAALSKPYHRLLSRVRRRYDTVTEMLRLGRLQFPFTRIADPNRVLDQVAAEEDRIERVSGRRA